MPRFFVPQGTLANDTVLLTGENADHARVLRLKPGETVTLCDGVNTECLCKIETSDPGNYVLTVLERGTPSTEASVKVSIYMAFSKGDKLEHVIQKTTELGACEIVAFPSARCVSRPDEKSLKKKLERWQKIAASAAEQSGRGTIPEVIALGSYKEALYRAANSDLSILFYENEHSTTLHHALSNNRFQSISLLTGPEGGLEESEVAKARDAGLQICTLGSSAMPSSILWHS